MGLAMVETISPSQSVTAPRWSHPEVVKRLRECGDTVRRLPPPRGPQGEQGFWPDVIRDASEAYGYTGATVRLPAPSPRAIDRMNECFTWFNFLADRPDEMKAMWLACGKGYKFSQVGRMLGIHRKTVRLRVWAAVTRVVNGLNGGIS